MPKKPIKGNTAILPARVATSKRYDYIKKIVVDGMPRIRAYAEAIDPTIYDLDGVQITNKLDYLRTAWTDYKDIEDMVKAEQQNWNLQRSAAAQNKAMELLNATLDRAIELVKDPDSDAKQLNTAVQTLKTIMPAFSKKEDAPVETRSAKMNAARFIN
jgi:hypothetical protein